LPPFHLILYRDAGDKPSGEMPRPRIKRQDVRTPANTRSERQLFVRQRRSPLPSCHAAG